MFIKFVSVYTVYYHNTNRLIIFYYSNIITCLSIIIVINDVEIVPNNNIVSLK